jgi:hypothetical protein
VVPFDFLLGGVIPSVAVLQAERGISLVTGLRASPTAPLPHGEAGWFKHLSGSTNTFLARSDFSVPSA